MLSMASRSCLAAVQLRFFSAWRLMLLSHASTMFNQDE